MDAWPDLDTLIEPFHPGEDMSRDGYWAGDFYGDTCYAEILFTLVE